MACKHLNQQSREPITDLESDMRFENLELENFMFGPLAEQSGLCKSEENQNCFKFTSWKLSKESIENLALRMTPHHLFELRTEVSPRESTLDAGYTYLGQMLTHEIVEDTNESDRREPMTPALNLESIYWHHDRLEDGNVFDDFGRFLLDDVETLKNRDLKRLQGRAQIPEQRNDENVIVAQMHVLWLRLHNKLISSVYGDEDNGEEDKKVPTSTKRTSLYYQAKAFLTLVFQRVIIEDYLRRILAREVYETYFLDQNLFIYKDVRTSDFKISREFSNAIFRFGHSMVRQRYRLNESRKSIVFLGDLFRPKESLNTLNLVEWDRFFFKEGGDQNKLQNSSRISMSIANGLRGITPGDLLNFDYENSDHVSRIQRYNTIDGEEPTIDQILDISSMLKHQIAASPGELKTSASTSSPQNRVEVFKDIIFRDIKASRGVPTGGDIVRLLQRNKVSGKLGRHSLSQSINHPSYRALEMITSFIKSGIFSDMTDSIPINSSACQAPLWLFTLREAECFPHMGSISLSKDNNHFHPISIPIDPNRLGSISSLVVAETISMSVRASEVNVFQSCSKIKKDLGEFADSYFRLLQDLPSLKMSDVIELSTNLNYGAITK